MELSPREKRTLEYIIETINNHGYSPSIRDIKNAVGFNSTSTVHYCLQKLEAYGYIQKEDGKSRTIRVEGLGTTSSTQVPLLGKVTAGQPILAEQNYEGYVSFIADSIGCSQENLFALKVSGESMIDAGIIDGDIVIVDRRDYANNGEIVVAMIEDSATVKTFYREDGHFRLQPENMTMEPIYSDKVIILGKVVASLRIY